MRAEIRVTPQAEEQAVAAASWWAQNRVAAPGLFTDELLGALDMLSGTPDVGRRYRRARIPGLRRILLPRTRYHVYYVHEPESCKVVVLAVWSAVRGQGPELASP